MERNKVFVLLIGALIVVPAEADAQRNRNRDRDDGRVERLEPVRAPGRVIDRGFNRPGRALDRRHRVVYSSRGYGARGRILWARADWGRVRMHTFGYNRGRVLNQRDLRNVVGNRAVNRIRQAGRRAGLRGQLRGHWVGSRGFGRVLLVRMGGVEIAELVDFDRDGFIDDIYVMRYGRGRQVVSRW